MDHPDLTVLNFMEKSIGLQKVQKYEDNEISKTV